jgi:hypothetical protein
MVLQRRGLHATYEEASGLLCARQQRSTGLQEDEGEIRCSVELANANGVEKMLFIARWIVLSFFYTCVYMFREFQKMSAVSV